jgi:hypothetical protein
VLRPFSQCQPPSIKAWATLNLSTRSSFGRFWLVVLTLVGVCFVSALLSA